MGKKAKGGEVGESQRAKAGKWLLKFLSAVVPQPSKMPPFHTLYSECDAVMGNLG